MGRDNHPRARQAAKLARKKPVKESYDRILIVTEGQKTEPYYFNEIRSAYRLHTANLKVYPSEYGTEPRQIVEFARDIFINGDVNKQIKSKYFEKVYAVFDRDNHQTYHEAIEMAEAWNGKKRNNLGNFVEFKAITSVPCFELWLLLHFELVTYNIHRDDVIRLLRNNSYIPGYTKGRSDIFSLTRDRLTLAYQNADELRAQRQRHGNENPNTDVQHLVKLLINLRS